jgi:hypothetical protein
MSMFFGLHDTKLLAHSYRDNRAIFKRNRRIGIALSIWLVGTLPYVLVKAAVSKSDFAKATIAFTPIVAILSPSPS